MNNIAGQAAKTERKLPAKIEKSADKRQNARQEKKCLTEFA